MNFENPPVTHAQTAEALAREAAALNKRIIGLTNQMRNNSQELKRLQLLKNRIQSRPNPLYNASFIHDELIDQYIESLTHDNRLTLLNHTELWNDEVDEEEDEVRSGKERSDGAS